MKTGVPAQDHLGWEFGAEGKGKSHATEELKQTVILSQEEEREDGISSPVRWIHLCFGFKTSA